MPERFHVIISMRTAREMTEICSWIERTSPQNASLVAQRLLAVIDSLDLFPHRYKGHEHRQDPAKTVRSMPVPPFIVYYRVDDVRRTVRVLSVRHGARRQPKRFR